MRKQAGIARPTIIPWRIPRLATTIIMTRRLAIRMPLSRIVSVRPMKSELS